MTGEAWFTLAYTVLGGLGVFLFGMKMLSESLQALASDFIRRLIGWLTNNRLIAMAVGVTLTVIVQSSTVTTVMLVGFINAGLMSLTQAVGVILGANIGTTITGWIIAIKIGKYGLLLIAAGFAPYFFSKRSSHRNVGKVLIALGLIFVGLQIMSGGFTPLAATEDFRNMLAFFAADNMLSVLACVLIGCILTFIVQSSSAMLAITMSLAATGQIDYPTAAALVLGENIGTTITMHLAAIGGTIDAKRASWAHIMFNVFGVCVMLAIFPFYVKFVSNLVEGLPGVVSGLFSTGGPESVEIDDRLILMKIAAGHSLFNITNNLMFLPILPLLVKFVIWFKPDKGRQSKKRLKMTADLGKVAPQLALEEAEGEIRIMAGVANEALERAAAYMRLPQDDPEIFKRVEHLEHISDNIQMEVTLFITEVLQLPMTPEQARRGYALIRISDEMESVVDYCQNLTKYRARMFRDGLKLSTDAEEELEGLLNQVRDFARSAMDYVISRHEAAMGDEEVRELIRMADAIGEKSDAVRDSHFERVKDGRCDPISGMIYSDIVVALRRIKNHTVNIIDARIGRWEERRESLRNLERPLRKATGKVIPPRQD
jgi:phosphate:Na+ symporter